eukprot:327649-Chlamydomonas_euryale.AAC.2
MQSRPQKWYTYTRRRRAHGRRIARRIACRIACRLYAGCMRAALGPHASCARIISRRTSGPHLGRMQAAHGLQAEGPAGRTWNAFKLHAETACSDPCTGAAALQARVRRTKPTLVRLHTSTLVCLPTHVVVQLVGACRSAHVVGVGAAERAINAVPFKEAEHVFVALQQVACGGRRTSVEARARACVRVCARA